MTAKRVRTTSISKGLLAGLIGGLAGAAAKVAAEKIFPPRVEGQPAPPLLLVERVNDEVKDEFHQSLTGAQKTAAVKTIHWAFGGLTGAAYGAIVELHPGTAAWQGAAFGLAVNRLTHEGALPVMGLNAPVNSQTPQERYSERATHVVYGVVTEVVRRMVRSRL